MFLNIEKQQFIHPHLEYFFPLHCCCVWRQRNKTSSIRIMADRAVFQFNGMPDCLCWSYYLVAFMEVCHTGCATEMAPEWFVCATTLNHWRCSAFPSPSDDTRVCWFDPVNSAFLRSVFYKYRKTNNKLLSHWLWDLSFVRTLRCNEIFWAC